jgi:hypothetical protein
MAAPFLPMRQSYKTKLENATKNGEKGGILLFKK